MNRKQDIREEKRMEDMTKQKERDVSHAGYGGWIRDIVISPRWMIRFIVGVRLLFRKKLIWRVFLIWKKHSFLYRMYVLPQIMKSILFWKLMLPMAKVRGNISVCIAIFKIVLK